MAKSTKAAETAAAEETMAAETAAAEKNEPVEVFIPKGFANEDPNFFVSVNGVSYLLPRGKKSKVPAHIAAEINRAQKAQDAYDELVAEMVEASK